jgi:hypothetical protein
MRHYGACFGYPDPTEPYVSEAWQRYVTVPRQYVYSAPRSMAVTVPETREVWANQLSRWNVRVVCLKE